jgi:uncharacterized membrane protein YdjX (TVP38/TMEM64 family)
MKYKVTLKRKPEPQDWINIASIILLTGVSIFVGIKYRHIFGEVNTSDIIGEAERLQSYILNYGETALAIIFGLQFMQVIVALIPSMVVQFAGGMIFGMGKGMLVGITGVAAGTAAAFYISRLLGKRMLTLFVSEKNIQRLEGLVSSDTSSLILLALYILPTPKDLIAYFLGVTKIKASRLFIISALGRLPGMFISTYLGAHLFERNYMLMAAVAGTAGLLSFLTFLFKGKILEVLRGEKR